MQLNYLKQIKNIMLFSGLFLSRSVISYFINSGFVYINRTLTNNLYKVVKPGDIIEIFLSLRVYYFIEILRLRSDNTMNVFKSIILKRFKLNKVLTNYDTHRLVEYYLNVVGQNFIIPIFLEVDVQSGSIFFLWNPNNNTHINILFKKICNPYLIKLCLWKFIN